MNDVMTGPMGASSYETLERDCLAGPLLEATTGEVGLAVAYKNRAFRFAAAIESVNRSGDICLVEADVVTLDGQSTQELTFETDPETGVIWTRSLNFGPVAQAGLKPQRACFYPAELSEIPREDDMLTEVDMDRFVGLAGDRRVARALVPGTGGTISREAAMHSRINSDERASYQNLRWTLFAGILPVRLPTHFR